MRYSVLSLIAIVMITNLYSQKVGVGLTSPEAQLHVRLMDYLLDKVLIVDTGLGVPHLIIMRNGNVGIGIANPTERLDVSGNVRFSGALMPGGNAGSVGQVLISQGPGVPPQWQDASAVGDNWGSQVAQTQNPIIGDGTAISPIGLQPGAATGDILVWDGSQWVIQQPGASTGITPLCNSPSVNFLQKWTGTEICNSIVYDNGINVGIGTNTPTERLDVAGNLKFSGSLMPGGNAGSPGFVLTSQGPGVAPTWTDPSFLGDNWGTQVAQTQGPVVGDGTNVNPITFAPGSSVGDVWQWNGTSWQLVQLKNAIGVAGYDSVCSSASSNFIQKWTGTELCNSIIIDNGGEVGIGISSPIARFHVEAPSTYNKALFLIRHDTNSVSNPFFIVTQDGRVGVGTANPVMKFEIDYPVSSPAFVVTSDVRFKEDIRSLGESGSVLERVTRLRGVYYYWNESYRNLGRGDERRHIGLIAQEVVEVFPELVYEWADGSGYYMVDYDGMVPVLLEALKELKVLVDAQQEKIRQLEKRIWEIQQNSSASVR